MYVSDIVKMLMIIKYTAKRLKVTCNKRQSLFKLEQKIFTLLLIQIHWVPLTTCNLIHKNVLVKH